MYAYQFLGRISLSQVDPSVWITVHITSVDKQFYLRGCSHSSVDSSAPSILLPQVLIPSTPSMFFKFLFDLCRVEKTKIKEKEAGIGSFFLKKKTNKFTITITLETCTLISSPGVFRHLPVLSYQCINRVIVQLNEAFMK